MNNSCLIDNDLPLVSVSTITYNHKDFIGRCIEGVLSQKTNFKIEYLIHDDCSTDGTTEIVKRYAEKYPDVIKPMYETENQYCKGGPWGSIVYNYPRAKGKYIALCEGDDFWTDPYKLQKQVDFMESHPEYSVCFHRFWNVNVYTRERQSDGNDELFRSQLNNDFAEISMNQNFNDVLLLPLTQMFRVGCLDYSLVHKYKYYRDTHENYHLLKNGKCALLSFYGAERNMHNGGVASLISTESQLIKSLEIANELYQANKDVYTKSYLSSIIDWSIAYTKPWSLQRLKQANQKLLLNHSVIEWLRILRRV